MSKNIYKIFGILFFMYSVLMTTLMNFNLGIVACYLISIFFIVIGFVKELGKFKILVNIGFVLIGIVAVFSTFLYIYGHNDTITYNEDALIVLGAGINGERVTYPLSKRLDEAVIFHGENPSGIIVVSGGQGPQEKITEALAMERYLINKGVNPNIIIKEEQATSTYENFMYSKDILDEYFKGEYNIGFVTTDFHIFRAEQTAKKVSYEKVTHVSSRSQTYSVPINYTREMMALIKFYIFD